MNSEIIDFDTLGKIIELNNIDYGYETCFDYIDSLLEIDGKKVVRCFIEPVGEIDSPKFGTFIECLQWWIDVFRSQPKELSYIQAGWHLYDKDLTTNPIDMWS